MATWSDLTVVARVCEFEEANNLVRYYPLIYIWQEVKSCVIARVICGA